MMVVVSIVRFGGGNGELVVIEEDGENFDEIGRGSGARGGGGDGRLLWWGLMVGLGRDRLVVVDLKKKKKVG